MKKITKLTGALASTALGVSGLAVTASPASAAHIKAPPCMVVNANMTLTANIVDCAGDGIVVTADNVTLNLNGFTVSGQKVEAEQAGILLDNVKNVVVKGGTVTGFDAGVAIDGGSGNTVTGMTVKNNVNDKIEAIDPRSIIVNPATGPTPQQMIDIGRITCDYGDGITTVDSNFNTIKNNVVTANGPYSGISLVGNSNNNKVSANKVIENDLINDGVTDGMGNPVFVQGPTIPGPTPGTTVPNPQRGFHTSASTPGAVRPPSMCGATEIGTPGMGRGRLIQSIGVRVEGPGADRNLVDNNVVTKGGLAGISFHSYVLVPAGPNVPIGDSNRNNVVSRNLVTKTGLDTSAIDSFADGIASLASGPVGTVTRPSDTNTIVSNRSNNNVRNGISLGRLSFDNTVDKNTVNNNGANGIFVAGPVAPNPANPSLDLRGAYDNNLSFNIGRGNGNGNGVTGFDGNDQNPDCDNNIWTGNTFRTVSRPCVRGIVGSPASAASAAAAPAEPTGGISHPSR